MINEINELKQSFLSINVKSNPSVLSRVFVRVGVEHLPVSQLYKLITELLKWFIQVKLITELLKWFEKQN